MEFYELIRKMEHQVNRTVKHYQNDFYAYDIPFLARAFNGKKPLEFAWFLRDTGTDLCSNKKDNVMTFEERKELYRRYNDLEFKITYTPFWSGGIWEMEKIS